MEAEAAKYIIENQTSQCQPIQVLIPDKVDAFEVKLTFGLLYSTVWLLGLFGNALVVYSALRRRVQFTVRGAFVVSLACSDLIIGLTSLPVTAIGIFSREWVFGSLLCHIIGFVQGSHIFISSFTLVAIAIDRYFLIVQPFRVKQQRLLARMLSIWALGYVFASPLAFYVQTVDAQVEGLPPICGEFCEETWPSANVRIAYGMAVLFVQFGIPLAVNTTCYAAINAKVKEQIVKRSACEVLLPKSLLQLARRRRRTTTMTVLMLASFILAWLPINFLNLARDFDLAEHVVSAEYFSTAFATTHLISMTSIIWNPVIYIGFLKTFRSQLKETAKCQQQQQLQVAAAMTLTEQQQQNRLTTRM